MLRKALQKESLQRSSNVNQINESIGSPMMEDEFDSQIAIEDVGYFNNNASLNSEIPVIINTVRKYTTEEEQNIEKVTKKTQKINSSAQKNKTLDWTFAESSQSLLQRYQCSQNVKELICWGLPQEIARKYAEKGIKEMFDWQVQCLKNAKVLLQYRNLVYSAPTSAGKTLVAEILTIKTVLERQKKVIIILPFVSIVREKTVYLQDILSSSGIRVEGFMGAQTPAGGFQSVHVAVCTIEKANSLVNRSLDEDGLSELGAVVVDELHLIGDPNRGYLLELLLTKVKYVSLTQKDVNVQIIGMSATLPNLNDLARWLNAELYLTSFRPIPLDEYCLVRKKLYSKGGIESRTLSDPDSELLDKDNVLKICFDTIKDGCSVLIFSMTKNRCEGLAQHIASSFYMLGRGDSKIAFIMRKELKTERISEVLEQLKNCPAGLDNLLKQVISFGVSYHHAGLTFDERDIIEAAFKSGAIRVLVATSTLSSGVNLPARVVIVRTPVFQRNPINIMTYKQMVGRAGRMGQDTKGESILICSEAEKIIGFNLMLGALEPVKSCMESGDKFLRAILEMVASEVACKHEDLTKYVKCTLYYYNTSLGLQYSLSKILSDLQSFELIRSQDEDGVEKYVATSLGKACLLSSMAPNDGMILFCELQKARECLVLETDLHLIYLVTPYSVSNQWPDIDWLHMLQICRSLTKAMERVAQMVGVHERYMMRFMKNKEIPSFQNVMNIHKRFYTALALQDLVNEVPLSEVATKFRCARGFLQSLQQSAATFAGMVTVFCHQLGWKNMEMLIAQFQDRLHFGIHSELLELMKLPSLNGLRARSLFNAGFETVASVASGDVNVIENALVKAVPFQSEKQRDDDDITDIRKRNKLKNVWITGHCALTPREAAANLIREARHCVERELGDNDIKWNNDIDDAKIDIEARVFSLESVIDSHIDSVIDSVINSALTTNVSSQNESKEPIRENNGVTINDYCRNESKKLVLEINGLTTIDSCQNECKELIRENNGVTINDYCRNESKELVLEINGLTTIDSCRNESKELLLEKNGLTINDSCRNESKELVWDSLEFTETAINNITRNRLSDQIFSPEISFSDSEIKTEPKEEESSIQESVSFAPKKDISLFSSDGENNNSLFDDSLPVYNIESKLLDNNTSETNHSAPEKPEMSTVITNSILQAFQQSNIEEELETTSTDETKLKLVYDDDIETASSSSQHESASLESHMHATSNNNQNLISALEQQPLARKRSMVKKNDYEGHFLQFVKTNNYLKTNDKQTRDFVTPDTEKTPVKHKYYESIFFKNFINYLQATETEETPKKRRKHTFENSSNCTKRIVERGVTLYIFEEDSILPKLGELLETNCAAIYFDLKEPAKRAYDNNVGEINFLGICCEKDIVYGFNLSPFFKTSLVYTFLRRWFSRNCLHLLVYSLKETAVTIKKHFAVEISASCYDICIGEWLLTQSVSKLDGDDLPTDNRTCFRAWNIWMTADRQRKDLHGHIVKQRLLAIDNQVALILSRSEKYGLAVDRKLASTLLVAVKDNMEVMEDTAYKIAGHRFNIHSSQEVAEVLGLSRPWKATSTKKSVLILNRSPLSDVIMYWRKLNAVLTKILYPIKEVTGNDMYLSKVSKIFPSYNMCTSTGRINTQGINLQCTPKTFHTSIPMFSNSNVLIIKQGKVLPIVNEFNCRNIFKASKGCVLVSADYCQLEMRILTHFCEDEKLIAIMQSDGDVFTSMAARWNEIDEASVDDNLRQRTKQLCYGIIYGMGNKALAEMLESSILEASVFVHTFYSTYPRIMEYRQRVIEDCCKNGYVETLMERRRFLPNINSKSNSGLKEQAQRQALNTIVQGSAADIVKAAMCEIESRILLCEMDDSIKPRLLLQMHDELIYEVPEENKQNFVSILKNAMETCVELKIPLPVKVKTGYTWGSLVELH